MKKSCSNFSGKRNLSKLLNLDFYNGFLSIQLAFVQKKAIFLKKGDKVLNCRTVGIEQTIKAIIFLIRIKMPQKTLEKCQILLENKAFFEIKQHFAQNRVCPLNGPRTVYIRSKP